MLAGHHHLSDRIPQCRKKIEAYRLSNKLLGDFPEPHKACVSEL